MKKHIQPLILGMMLLLALPAHAQLIKGPRGYEDFKSVLRVTLIAISIWIRHSPS